MDEKHFLRIKELHDHSPAQPNVDDHGDLISYVERLRAENRLLRMDLNEVEQYIQRCRTIMHSISERIENRLAKSND